MKSIADLLQEEWDHLNEYLSAGRERDAYDAEDFQEKTTQYLIEALREIDSKSVDL